MFTYATRCSELIDMIFLLPFGSFRKKATRDCLYSQINGATFYSLLGVSLLASTSRLCCTSQHCFLLPFGSFNNHFLQVSTSLNSNVLFLLPFGSFDLSTSVTPIIEANFITFYSLLGVSSVIICYVVVEGARGLSTPFWEFRCRDLQKMDLRING